MKPKVRVNEKTLAIEYRKGLSRDEIDELTEIVRQAFNAGLRSGYEQGRAA